MSSSSAAFTPEYLAANKGPHILAIIIVFPILAFLVVLLRLHTRLSVVQHASWEDFTIVLALIFSFASSVCQGFQVYNGMGRHIQTLTLDQGIASLKALYASIMMYNFGLTLVKVSIVLQYIRITVDPIVRKVCWVLLSIILLTCLETFLTGTLTCYPIAKFWDDRIPGGCLNRNALWYANAGINIFTDICLIVLPAFILRKLQLRSREKYSLALILGLGGFASIASVLRLNALYVLSVSTDISWDNPGTATWSAIELNCGIICASLPTLRAFLIRHFPKVFRSTRGSTPNAQAGYEAKRMSGEHQLIGRNLMRPSVTTDISIVIQDIEKVDGTFLASDSERDFTRANYVRS